MWQGMLQRQPYLGFPSLEDFFSNFKPAKIFVEEPSLTVRVVQLYNSAFVDARFGEVSACMAYMFEVALLEDRPL